VWDQMTRHLQKCHIAALRIGRQFSGNSAEKTTDNTVQHRGGGGCSMVANHRGGGESSMVVTTLLDAGV